MPITFDSIQDYVGFGAIVEGRDFESGCEYLADFKGQIEITGIEEINNEIKTVSTIINSEENVLEYNAEILIIMKIVLIISILKLNMV